MEIHIAGDLIFSTPYFSFNRLSLEKFSWHGTTEEGGDTNEIQKKKGFDGETFTNNKKHFLFIVVLSKSNME